MRFQRGMLKLGPPELRLAMRPELSACQKAQNSKDSVMCQLIN